MNLLPSTALIPFHFIHMVFGTTVLAWWFLSQKGRSSKKFGWGMAGYALGLAAWTFLVWTKPVDMKPLILLGVIPFLAAHVAYAKAASKKNTLVIITLLLIAATFVVRTFLHPSEPYFSSEGLLFFGIDPIAVAFYIATISVSFLPAIGAAVSEIKDKSTKSIMGVGLTVLYVNSIILVSAKDSTLLVVNGWVMGIALIALWFKALSTGVKRK